jgi:hypothetical protein
VGHRSRSRLEVAAIFLDIVPTPVGITKLSIEEYDTVWISTCGAKNKRPPPLKAEVFLSVTPKCCAACYKHLSLARNDPDDDSIVSG